VTPPTVRASPFDGAARLGGGRVLMSYWQPTVLLLVDYIKRDILKVVGGPNRPLGSGKKALALDVTLDEATLILPPTPGGVSGLRATIGDLRVSNTLSGDQLDVDTICVLVARALKLESVGAPAASASAAASAPVAARVLAGSAPFEAKGDTIIGGGDAPKLSVNVAMNLHGTDDAPLPMQARPPPHNTHVPRLTSRRHAAMPPCRRAAWPPQCSIFLGFHPTPARSQLDIEWRALRLQLSEVQTHALMGVFHCNFIEEIMRRGRLLLDSETAEARVRAGRAFVQAKAAEAAKAQAARGRPPSGAKLGVSASAMSFRMHLMPPIGEFDVPRGFTLLLSHAHATYEDVALTLDKLRVDKRDGDDEDAFAIAGRTLTCSLPPTRPSLASQSVGQQLGELGPLVQAFTQPTPWPTNPDPPKPLKIQWTHETVGVELAHTGHAGAAAAKDRTTVACVRWLQRRRHIAPHPASTPHPPSAPPGPGGRPRICRPRTRRAPRRFDWLHTTERRHRRVSTSSQARRRHVAASLVGGAGERELTPRG
jgi:hypothetical protein